MYGTICLKTLLTSLLAAFQRTITLVDFNVFLKYV